MKKYAVIFLALIMCTACGPKPTDMFVREAYWQAEVKAHLAAGASREQIVAFFAQRGVKLECCFSVYQNTKVTYYSGYDPIGAENVGRWVMQLKINVPVWGDSFTGAIDFTILPRQ